MKDELCNTLYDDGGGVGVESVVSISCKDMSLVIRTDTQSVIYMDMFFLQTNTINRQNKTNKIQNKFN